MKPAGGGGIGAEDTLAGGGGGQGGGGGGVGAGGRAGLEVEGVVGADWQVRFGKVVVGESFRSSARLATAKKCGHL